MDSITSALAESAQELRALQQVNFNTAARQLGAFLQSRAACVVPKGDKSTNVIDQGKAANYRLDNLGLAELFVHLEACRRTGVDCHFSERQGSQESPLSGIMLDFDLALKNAPTGTSSVPTCINAENIPHVPNVLDDRTCQQLSGIVVRQLAKDLKFEGEVSIQLFFIVRATAPRIEDGPARDMYKYGFHILIPGVRVTRGYKKYLISKLRDNSRLTRALGALGVAGAPNAPDGAASCVDTGSASVPVLFVGSSKRGKTPYPIASAFEVQAEAEDLEDGGFAISPITPEVLKKYNLCYELSLWARPPPEMLAHAQATRGATLGMGGDKALTCGLVTPKDYKYKSTIASKVESLSDRMAGNMLGAGEARETEAEVDSLCSIDSEARYLRQVLALLDETYYTEYPKWCNVIFALAHTSRVRSHDYLPLARWFSQRCADKWSNGGREALDQLWADVMIKVGQINPAVRPLTRRSIIYWASQCQPERFRELSRSSNFNVMGRYVFKHGGALQHGMIAEVVHTLVQNRFAVDTIETPSSKMCYNWYEFVLPGQPMCPGEVWKWRREGNPDALHALISGELVDIANQIADEVKEKAQHAKDDQEAKYYKEVGKKLASSINKLYDNNFKKNAIEQTQYMFRQRGFIKSLDSTPDIFGVANGILRLAAPGRPKTELINSYHEWPVMRYSTVQYRKFDPKEPWTKLMLESISKVVPEPDMRVWIMMFFSTGLYHGLKNPILLLGVGSGSNAKTWLARMVEKVLGDYATKLVIALLTAEREDPNKPNSAVMRLKERGFGYFEESSKYEVLNESRVKEIINPGAMSASEKGRIQESFELKATIISLSNFDFIVNMRDDGTWRRLRHYTFKAKFCDDPDPRNPYEHKGDRRFIQEFVNDPGCQTAFLSILVHFWERLQNEYDGDLDKVPCPTLTTETEIYRNTQDVLNRFISERVVDSPAHEEVYQLPDFASAFSEWYRRNIVQTGTDRYVATEVIKDFENSRLVRYLSTAANGQRVISGCRLLTPRETELKEGESYIGERAKNIHSPMRSDAIPPGVDWWNWRPMETKGPPTPPPKKGESVSVTGTGYTPEERLAMFADDMQVNDGMLRRKHERKEKVAKEVAAAAAIDDFLEDACGEPSAKLLQTAALITKPTSAPQETAPPTIAPAPREMPKTRKEAVAAMSSTDLNSLLAAVS